MTSTQASVGTNHFDRFVVGQFRPPGTQLLDQAAAEAHRIDRAPPAGTLAPRMKRLGNSKVSASGATALIHDLRFAVGERTSTGKGMLVNIH